MCILAFRLLCSSPHLAFLGCSEPLTLLAFAPLLLPSHCSRYAFVLYLYGHAGHVPGVLPSTVYMRLYAFCRLFRTIYLLPALVPAILDCRRRHCYRSVCFFMPCCGSATGVPGRGADYGLPVCATGCSYCTFIACLHTVVVFSSLFLAVCCLL
jgi:hypothetical protein